MARNVRISRRSFMTSVGTATVVPVMLGSPASAAPPHHVRPDEADAEKLQARELQLADTMAAVTAGFRMTRPRVPDFEERWRWRCTVGAVAMMLGELHDWKQEHYENFRRDCGLDEAWAEF
jgi:hypothetical protein